MAWPHSITQVLTQGSERSNGWIPPPVTPSTAKWCHNLHGKPCRARDALHISSGQFWAWFCITSATLTQPAPIISILQARDSSTEMQHTHNTTQHTFSTTWNNLNIIAFFFPQKNKKINKQTFNGHKSILIGRNIYNMKLLDWFLVLFFSVIL